MQLHKYTPPSETKKRATTVHLGRERVQVHTNTRGPMWADDARYMQSVGEAECDTGDGGMDVHKEGSGERWEVV